LLQSQQKFFLPEVDDEAELLVINAGLSLQNCVLCEQDTAVPIITSHCSTT